MTDYEVRTAAGRVLLTTPDKKLAVKRARQGRDLFPGIYIEEIERVERRKVIYRARVAQVERAA